MVRLASVAPLPFSAAQLSCQCHSGNTMIGDRRVATATSIPKIRSRRCQIPQFTPPLVTCLVRARLKSGAADRHRRYIFNNSATGEITGMRSETKTMAPEPFTRWRNVSAQRI